MAENGPITSKRRWPYPSYAFSTPYNLTVASTPGISPRQTDSPSAPITSRQRFIYTSWTGPILAPELFEAAAPFDASTDYPEWAPTWPQPYVGKRNHPAYTQVRSVGPLIWPYDEKQIGWLLQSPGPVIAKIVHPSISSTTGAVKVFFNLEINPAMWLPVYPDQLRPAQRPLQGWNAFVISDTSSVILIAGIDSWGPRYPVQIWTHKPHYFSDQAWAGILKQQPGYEWIVQHPDFVRGLPPTYLLPTGMVKPVATIPNVAFEVTSWLFQNIDFPGRKSPNTFYLQTFSYWNTIQGLVDQGGNNSFIFYRRRRR